MTAMFNQMHILRQIGEIATFSKVFSTKSDIFLYIATFAVASHALDVELHCPLVFIYVLTTDFLFKSLDMHFEI